MIEKLTELIGKAQDEGRDYSDCFIEGDKPRSIENTELAKYLIDNGVVIPVRCGECKYGDDEGGTALNFRVCRLSKRSELLDWYCPYGKRRKRSGE